MSRFIVLLGLFVTMVAVYGGDMDQCCKENESWTLCGKFCESSCAFPQGEPCPKLQCTNCTAGCRCNNGYVRDTNGLCVLYKDCNKNKNE